MFHSLSPPCLSPNLKKRKISVTKKSNQKLSIQTMTQLPTKSSQKQYKSKITTLQNPIDEQSYKSNIKSIYSLNDRSFLQQINDGNYEQALVTLQKVKSLIDIHSRLHTDPIKSISTTTFPFIIPIGPLHCNSNFQKLFCRLGEGQSSAKQMQLAIKNFQNVQGYMLLKEENLAHTSEWVKLNLQYFTTLSNVNKHLEAIVCAQKCIQKISESLKILEAMCAQNLAFNETPQTLATETESRVKSEKVNFKRIVIKQAQKILKEIDISSPHKLITENKQIFQQKIKNIYFWRTNLQNNVKFAQKELLEKGKIHSSSRNLLGVQKTSNFTEQFSLGELMSLNTRKMKQKLNVDQYFLLSSSKIVELILFASVCYFTMATQTRFKQIQADINSLKITQKYQRLNKDKMIFKCKVFHLKAIELAAKYLPETNSYFTHILNSFNKNYKSILDEINEQSQTSMKSYDRSLEKYKKQSQAIKDGMNQQYGMRNLHLQNNLHLSSKTQKRQITQKNQKLMHQNIALKPNIRRKHTNSKDKQPLSKRKLSSNKKNIN